MSNTEFSYHSEEDGKTYWVNKKTNTIYCEISNRFYECTEAGEPLCEVEKLPTDIFRRDA